MQHPQSECLHHSELAIQCIQQYANVQQVMSQRHFCFPHLQEMLTDCCRLVCYHQQKHLELPSLPFYCAHGLLLWGHCSNHQRQQSPECRNEHVRNECTA